jgi:hypothetical protein
MTADPRAAGIVGAAVRADHRSQESPFAGDALLSHFPAKY